MQQVANHLSNKAYREAFVRLRVLGLDGTTLRDWEQKRGDAKAFKQAKTRFEDALEHESKSKSNLDPKAIAQNPLALLQALDEYLFSSRALSAPSLRTSNRVPPEKQQYLENGKHYWLVPVLLANRRKASLAKQPGNLSHWVHHHSVLSAKTPHGIQVELHHTQSTVDDKLHALWQDDQSDPPSLKVWIAHFNDLATVKGSTAQSAVGDWRATHIEPSAHRMASLHSTMVQADAAGAHVIVFPELTIDVAQRHLLTRYLRKQPGDHLVMLQTGSFHETLASEGKTFNTAPLINAQGSLLFTHRKLRQFSSKSSPDADPVTEDISVGNTIHVLATPVGLLTVLVCKDFLDDHPSVLTLLSDVPVEWVLVPSFGDEKTIRLHKAHARSQAHVRTGCHIALAQIFNNIDAPTREPEECVRGFGHIGGNPNPEGQVLENGGLVVFPLLREDLPQAAVPGKRHLKRII